MLIPFNTLVTKYGIKPTGIFHVGANTGQELEDYEANGVGNIIFVEAVPSVYKNLVAHCKHHPQVHTIWACCSDLNGEEVHFNITNNGGQSSSMFEFGTHSKMHPEVHVVAKIDLITVRADTLCAQYNLDVSDYNFLNIDVQGAELKVLKGMGEDLRKIQYAYIEVNRDELYVGCARVQDIDAYLLEYGLHRKEMEMTNFGWGDAFYMR